MKTKCYCVGCKKHPLHEKRSEFKSWVTGYPKTIYKDEEKAQGADVDCFDPSSGFFEDTCCDKDDFEFKVCAYGDGSTQAECEEIGYTIYAHCGNEDHED